MHNDSTVQTLKRILLPPDSSSTMFNPKDAKYWKDFIFSQKCHQIISFSFIPAQKKQQNPPPKKSEKVLRPPSENVIAQS